MMKRYVRAAVSLFAALAVMFSLALSAAALDDTYRFDRFGMSVKVSKNYHVITADTPEDDEIFTTLRYDKTAIMSDFEKNNIYMRAYDPEYTFRISLTVNDSSGVNNLAELSDAELRGRLDALGEKTGVTDAVKRDHGGLTFFDVRQELTGSDGEPLYIAQCETVVNGKCIDLILQKEKEAILQNEEDALYTIAASMEFDHVDTEDGGPVFSWWRLLLWIVILVALSVVISLIYKHQNAVRRRRLEERRQRRSAAASAENAAPGAPDPADSSVTFDEFLGYHEADRFSSRAATDLDSFDISVREKDPTHGIVYFEDEGKSIDDRGDDYFDNYFREPTPRRSGISRMFSSVGAYIGIFFRHLGYFFRNLFKRKPKNKNRK